jgi:hypothetical protein
LKESYEEILSYQKESLVSAVKAKLDKVKTVKQILAFTNKWFDDKIDLNFKGVAKQFFSLYLILSKDIIKLT